MLRLHVAADTPTWFHIGFYRQGKHLVLKARTDALLAEARPLGPPDRDWNWPVFEYPVPCDWEPGAYLAAFLPSDDADPHEVTERPIEEAVLFVVRSHQPSSKILYKLPLFTYHAYNELGEPCGSLYTGGYHRLTLHRPGGGVGGRPWDHYFPDVYDPASPRQTFWHWDAPFIAWLERKRFTVDFCTDLDIHENSENFLARYRLLLSVGHDEYWSEPMRRHVATFIEETAGNVAFFSGNTCWWRVHLVDENTGFICNKTPAAGGTQENDQWFRFDPENRLTGVSHRNGGGLWWGEREALGYTVQHCDHWVFDGTGLHDGDTFGADKALVGYECDGAAVSDRADEGGFLVPSHVDGTPRSFLILGTAKLGPDWAQDPQGFRGGRIATMGIYANNGLVFNAATTDWSRALANGEPRVVRITENILRRLGSDDLEEVGARSLGGDHSLWI